MSARAWLVVELDHRPSGGGVVVGETVTRQAADVLARQLAGTPRAVSLGLTFEVVEVDDARAVDWPRASRVWVSDARVAQIVDGPVRSR